MFCENTNEDSILVTHSDRGTDRRIFSSDPNHRQHLGQPSLAIATINASSIDHTHNQSVESTYSDVKIAQNELNSMRRKVFDKYDADAGVRQTS